MLLSRLPMETWDVPTSSAVNRNLPARRLIVHRWMAVLFVLDLTGLAGGLAALELRDSIVSAGGAQFWIGLGGGAALWLLVAHGQHLYDGALMLSNRPVLARAAMAVAATFVIFLLLAAGWEKETVAAMYWQLGCMLATAGWVLATRGIWSACLRAAIQDGRYVEHVLVVAENSLSARWAAARIERSTMGRVCVAASTAICAEDAAQNSGLAHGICSIEAIEAAVRTNRLDRVIVVGVDNGRAWLGEAGSALVERLARLAIDVTIIPGGHALALAPNSAMRLGGLLGIDLVSRPFSRVKATVKRVEDVVVAGAILIFAAPAMLVAAALIRLESPGPALFRQRRLGFHDQVFRVWKFRTMYTHLADEAASVQTSRGDLRVTRMGRLLRRTSLDELPQFFNVLLGEMSVVGPRPHAVGMTVAGQQMHDLADTYSARHRIRPGVTGWAQVNGCRGEINSKQKLCRRLALDCHYITHWSLAFDISIMARTVATLVFDRQAY